MSLSNHIDLHQFSGPHALARAAAERWLAPTAPIYRYVAVSGGRIARLFFSAAAELALKDAQVAERLRQTHFFWADERCVPPDHPESNYRLAKEALFDRLDIRPHFVHRLKGELEPDPAVSVANAEVERTMPLNSAGVPVFDLVFLGMGEDGHIASLFPDGPTFTATSTSPYAAVVGPKPPNPRITLTYPMLTTASQVWVLISGEGKLPALHNSLEDKALTPLNRLLHLRESTTLDVDRIILNNTSDGKVQTVGN